jgi:hypothetical protein
MIKEAVFQERPLSGHANDPSGQTAEAQSLMHEYRV